MDFFIIPMDAFEGILGLTWFDRFMIVVFGKGVNTLILDMQGHGVHVQCVRPIEKGIDAKGDPKQSSTTAPTKQLDAYTAKKTKSKRREDYWQNK